MPEEGELEAEISPVGRSQVTRVVPPLRAEFRVTEVIAWELILVPGQCKPECLAGGNRADDDQGAESKNTTPHALPRSDSAGTQLEPDRVHSTPLHRIQPITRQSAPQQASGTVSSSRTTAY